MSNYEFSIRSCADLDIEFVTALIRDDLKQFFEQTSEGWSEEKLALTDISNIDILVYKDIDVGLVNRETSSLFGGGVYFRNLHVRSQYRDKGAGIFGLRCVDDYAVQAGFDCMFGKVFRQNPYLEWLERRGFNIVEDIPYENSVWVLRRV